MDSTSSLYTCEICGAQFETPGGKGGHKGGHDSKVSRDAIQAELRRLADEIGRTPTAELMDKEGKYSANLVASRFGSWNEALRSTGMMPNQWADITPENLLADIRGVAEQLGHQPTAADQRELGTYCVTHAQDVFGSWNSALRAAGFEAHQEKGLSDNDLLDGIHDLVETLGRVPTAAEMSAHGRFSHRPYFRRWDGWQAAIRAAGYEPVGRPSGPDNHNWKEQPVHEWREYGANWDEQRQKALTRDDFSCQTPGCEWTHEAHREAFRGELHVHHIRPLSAFVMDDSEVNFERANRLENLVTVCAEHHHLWERASPLRLDTR